MTLRPDGKGARIATDGVRGGLLIALAVALTFANAVHDGFHFDDEHSLVGNPHIRDLASVPDFFTDPQLFSRNVGSEMYRPLVLVSYALTYRVSGYKAGSYHLGNIALHLAVALAVYGLYRRMGLSGGYGLGAALLFAVHPLVGEPVNYVSSRSESLAAFFVILGLWCYLDGARWGLAAALCCYMAALGSKSSAIVLPAVLLLYELLARGQGRPPAWRRLLPFAAVAAGYLWTSQRLWQKAVAGAPVRGWHEQLATQAKAVTYYAKLVLLPRPLSVEHQFAEAGSWWEGAVLLSLGLLGSLLYVLWRGRHRAPLILWAGLAGAALAPTLLVPLNVLVNERRLYLPLVALIGLGAWVLQRQGPNRSLHIAMVVLVLACMMVTQQRNIAWQSEKSLWSDARAKAPEMVRPHLKLGLLHRAAGDLSAAAAAYDRALSLDPDHAPAHNNYGNLHRDTGDEQAAEAAYLRALAILPGYPEALVNLATLYSDQGRFAAALPLYRRALDTGGERLEVYNNLATAHLKMGDYRDAEEVLIRAIGLGATPARIYFNLGGALEGQGKADDAIQAYGRALEIDPTYAPAHYNSALLYEAGGKRTSAIAAYRAFVRYWRGAPEFRERAAERLRLLEAGQP